MTAGSHRMLKNGGFTLIEIIVTIVVAAVLAAIMVQFVSTAMTRSGDPAAAVRTEAATGTIMEGIVSEYVEQINTNPATALALLKTIYASDPNVTMTYIRFNAAGQEVVEDPTATSTLKVTVQGTGYEVTTLLTNSRTKSDDPVSTY